MRRLWVVAGLVGLVGGLALGFAVGARFWVRPWNPAWVEAWGTWVGAIASTAILAILTFRLTIRSERFTRGLEAERQASERELEAERQARVEDEAQRREQVEANGVICDAWATSQRHEDGTRIADAVAVTVTNHAGGVVSDVECVVGLGGIGSVHLRDALASDEQIGPTDLPAKEPIRLSADDDEVRCVRVSERRFHVLAEWPAVVCCLLDAQAVRIPKV